MINAASHCASIGSSSGCIERSGRLPPKNFVSRTCVSPTEVREELSTATVAISSIGTLLTSSMLRTAPRAAMATRGITTRPGIVAQVMTGTIPMSAVPSWRARAHCDGTV